MGQYLSFQLNHQYRGMLLTDEIDEVLSIQAHKILSIFDVAPYVMGVYNYRGEILWFVDLPKFLGFSTLFEQQNQSHFSILLLQYQGKKLGVGIYQIGPLWLGTPNPVQTSENTRYPAMLELCAIGVQTAQGNSCFALSREKIFQQLQVLEAV